MGNVTGSWYQFLAVERRNEKPSVASDCASATPRRNVNHEYVVNLVSMGACYGIRTAYRGPDCYPNRTCSALALLSRGRLSLVRFFFDAAAVAIIPAEQAAKEAAKSASVVLANNWRNK